MRRMNLPFAPGKGVSSDVGGDNEHGRRLRGRHTSVGCDASRHPRRCERLTMTMMMVMMMMMMAIGKAQDVRDEEKQGSPKSRRLSMTQTKQPQSTKICVAARYNMRCALRIARRQSAIVEVKHSGLEGRREEEAWRTSFHPGTLFSQPSPATAPIPPLPPSIAASLEGRRHTPGPAILANPRGHIKTHTHTHIYRYI